MVNPEHFELPQRRYLNESFSRGKGVKNWKALFKKPNLLEWTILIMLILALLMVWAYNRDISACREAIITLQDNACEICNNILRLGEQGEQGIDLSNITSNMTFNEGTNKE